MVDRDGPVARSSLRARSAAATTTALEGDEAAFDALEQLADTELVDAQVQLVRLLLEGLMETLRQTDGDHSLGFRRSALTWVLAPHGGNHFLELSKLGLSLEVAELIRVWEQLSDDAIDPEHLTIEDNPAARHREGLLGQPKDFAASLLDGQTSVHRRHR